MNYFSSLAKPFHHVEQGIDVFEFHSLKETFEIASDCTKHDPNGIKQCPLHWAGVFEDNLEAFYRQQGAQKALADFRVAEAALPLHGAPGGVAPRPYGGAWVIPEVIQGSPLPARIRLKNRLPPKSLRLHLTVSAFVDFADIARVAAKVARAAWDYTLRGGIIDCIVCYEAGYQKQSSRDTNGLCVKMHCPISSEWDFAQACSIQFYREIVLPMGIAMSGKPRDALRVQTAFAAPEYARITGRGSDDAELLRIGVE